jgi:hypothetical protein
MGKSLNGLILLTALATPAAGISLTTFQDPLGVRGTEAAGLSVNPNGISIVGNYNDSFGADHGFIYDGSSFKTVDDSPTDQSISTIVAGVSGDIVVGDTLDISDGFSSAHADGFLFDGTTFKFFDDPLATNIGTFPTGIFGNNVVGTYGTPSGSYGFLYDGSTFITLNDPLGVHGAYPQGISGSTVVGYYLDASNFSHGFIYDGTNYTTLDDPVGVHGTQPLGVSGKYIIGIYLDSANKQHDFLYDGSKFTTLDNLGGVTGTKITGISGNTVVGWYIDASLGHTVSFIATIPETSTLILAAIGGLALLAYRRRR